MTSYILQTVAFQLLFLLFYEWVLKKETFFQWNRAYLLVAPIIALALPFVKIPALSAAIPQNFIVSLPEVTLSAATSTAESVAINSSTSLSSVQIVLILGMAISLLLFIYKILKIIKIKKKGTIEIHKNSTLVHLPNSTEAFSFAGTIYLGENLHIASKQEILAHEQVHVQQKHYVDLLYFEVLRILFWFNPLVYLYQKRTAEVHEFIADAHVASTTEKTSYYQKLLSEVFQTQHISFINTFFNHSLIKKRIVMLHKSKSKKSKLVKFALLLPVLAGMLLYTSCSQEIETPTQESTITQKIEELKQAIENNPEGISSEQQKELLELFSAKAMRDKNNQKALGLYDKGEMDALPFAVIDQVPIYPGCENLATNEERKQCMSEKIDALVVNNFNKDIFKGSGLNGRVRLSVLFKIDKQGNVVDVLSRAPINILEEEAKRVINLIPKMQPGKQDGKEVAVTYSLPIVFQAESKDE